MNTYRHFTRTSTQCGTTPSSPKPHPQSRKTTPSHYPTQRSSKLSSGLPAAYTSGVSSRRASSKNGLTKFQVGYPAQTRSNRLPLTLRLRLGEPTGIKILLDSDVLRPYHRTRPTHDPLCDGVWPKEVDEPPYKRTVRISLSRMSLTLLSTRTTTHTHQLVMYRPGLA